MPTYDKRDYRSWKLVKHGDSTDHPLLKKISLAEARHWGMEDSLIITPIAETQQAPSKDIETT